MQIPADKNLAGANLRGANLRGVDLCGANLRDANLRAADLINANLRGADLASSDLYCADLSYANLDGANLTGVDLIGVDLIGATLYYARLTDADLTDAKLPHYQVCPEVGSFIAYKKLLEGAVATLEIPANARRTSSLVGRKCRAEFAKVISITTLNGLAAAEGYSLNDNSFCYKVGEIVKPHDYSDDIRIECAPGIHFFITKREAEEY